MLSDAPWRRSSFARWFALNRQLAVRPPGSAVPYLCHDRRLHACACVDVDVDVHAHVDVDVYVYVYVHVYVHVHVPRNLLHVLLPTPLTTVGPLRARRPET